MWLGLQSDTQRCAALASLHSAAAEPLEALGARGLGGGCRLRRRTGSAGFLTFARLGVDGGQFLRAARALGLVGAAKKDRFGCTDYLTWPNVSVMVNPITNPIDDKAYKAAVGEATPIADALNDNAAVQMRTWVQFGGLPHNKTMRRVEMIGKIMRRVEMIGERVLPQLAKLG